MNLVTLMGRLTKDPDIKRTAGTNMAIASFTLAVNRKFNKKGEEKQADFVMCKAFDKTAEFIEKYFTKGQQVAITGRIQTGSYEKDGKKVFTTDIIVENTYFADSKQSGGGESQSQSVEFSSTETIETDELPF